MSCAIEILSFQNFYKVLKTGSAGRKDFFDTLTGGHRTVGIFCRYMEKRRGWATALLHYLRERIREEKEKKEKSILKQRSGEIAVTGIRQKNGNGLAFEFRPFGQL